MGGPLLSADPGRDQAAPGRRASRGRRSGPGRRRAAWPACPADSSRETPLTDQDRPVRRAAVHHHERAVGGQAGTGRASWRSTCPRRPGAPRAGPARRTAALGAPADQAQPLDDEALAGVEGRPARWYGAGGGLPGGRWSAPGRARPCDAAHGRCLAAGRPRLGGPTAGVAPGRGTRRRGHRGSGRRGAGRARGAGGGRAPEPAAGRGGGPRLRGRRRRVARAARRPVPALGRAGIEPHRGEVDDVARRRRPPRGGGDLDRAHVDDDRVRPGGRASRGAGAPGPRPRSRPAWPGRGRRSAASRRPGRATGAARGRPRSACRCRGATTRRPTGRLARARCRGRRAPRRRPGRPGAAPPAISGDAGPARARRGGTAGRPRPRPRRPSVQAMARSRANA